MGKVKIKKKAIWIDMTPMSDVMVLLLTFFMLTSTFVKNEAVKVLTPGSVSELKVPENNVLSILIDSRGKVFLGWDKPGDMEAALSTMADQFGVSLNGTQMKNSRSATNIGVSMEDMGAFLSQDAAHMNDYQKDVEIFKKRWFKKARKDRIKEMIDISTEKLKEDLYQAFGFETESSSEL